MQEMTAEGEHLDSEVASLAAQREELAMLRAELMVERAEPASLRADLETERGETAALRRPLEGETVRISIPETAEEDSSIKPVEEGPAAAQTQDPAGRDTPRPTDDDVFARLRALSLLREGDDTAEPVESTPAVERQEAPPRPEAQVEGHPAPARPSSTATGHHDEDESIDDYMAQLFARLNGARSGAAPAPTAPAPTAPAPAAPKQESPADETAAPAASEKAELAAPVENEPDLPPLESLAMPRRSAPESQANLIALRELANMSASSAIGASQRQQRVKSGTLKMGAAGALGAVGALLLLLASSGCVDHSSVTLLGFGCVLLVAGILWLLQGLGRMALRFLQSLSPSYV